MSYGSPMTQIFDLFSESDLSDAIAAKLVKATKHPDCDDVIFNYTDAAMWTPGAWENPAVRVCRGLIVGDENEVIARPWPKFFNVGQPEAAKIELDEPVEVTDKMDGSLGIIYVDINGVPAVATRGSFSSEQAVHATAWLRERIEQTGWFPWNSYPTPLVEIIYPENRIVLDYGATNELILLGAVDRETGETYGPEEARVALNWPWRTTLTYEYGTLKDALAAPARKNAEGFVVRTHDGRMVKIKQEDYKLMHRVLFGMSARTIWQALAVEACRDMIHDPRHWGSYLGIDAQIVEGMPKFHDLIDTPGIPDEVRDWAVAVSDDIIRGRAELLLEAGVLAGQVLDLDPREQWEAVKNNPLRGEILTYARKGDIVPLTLKSWRLARPTGTKTPFSRNEDIA